ncbi:MAG TPA: universal stress protein [Candidatus Deferrimicrobium sp.]|nr:universal stress protein [Candidatus Deferrimicrobium sp.]
MATTGAKSQSHKRSTPTSARPTIRRILVPIDGSVPSEHAVDMAIEIAAALDAEVRVIHVTEKGTPSGVRIEPEGVTFRWESPKASVTLVAAAARRCRNAGIVATTQVLDRFEPVSDEILEVAKAFQADLIVIGSVGRGGLASLLMGSVARKVVGHSPIPVLIIR